MKEKTSNRRMQKGKQTRKKPSANLLFNTSMVKPKQLGEAKPRKPLEKVFEQAYMSACVFKKESCQRGFILF